MKEAMNELTKNDIEILKLVSDGLALNKKFKEIKKRR